MRLETVQRPQAGASPSLWPQIRRFPDREALSARTGIELPPADEMDAAWAMLIAVGVRNGVEDLHAVGAFDDAQAPSFNRTVRDEIYEALIALRRLNPGDPDDLFRAFLVDRGPLPTATTDDFTTAVVCAAVARAVSRFASIEDIPAAGTRDLTVAASEGARKSIEPLLDLSSPNAPMSVMWLLRSVPSYWEPPQVGPGLRALLADS